MYSAVYAEFLKLRSHRATWALVWIYPILISIVSLVAIGIDIYGSPAQGFAPDAVQWIGRSRFVWDNLTGVFGRYLIAAFAAFVVAGEYSWNTWKLTIPARTRWQLIVAKWIAVVALLYAALLLADLIMISGMLLSPLIGGAAIPDGVSVQAFLYAHATGFANAAFPIVYTVAWAGLLAVLTHSMLATAITSIIIITLEQFHVKMAALASYFSADVTRVALDILPLYHAANVIEYLRSGSPRVIIFFDESKFFMGWEASSVIIIAWIVGLGALTLIRFQRQDIN